MPSSLTRTVTLRLSNDALKVAGERAKKQGTTVGAYLKQWLNRELMRKHGA